MIHFAGGVRLTKVPTAQEAIGLLHRQEAEVVVWNGVPSEENCHVLASLLGGCRSNLAMFEPIRNIKYDRRKKASIAESCSPHPLHTDGSFETVPPEFFFLQVVEADDAGGGVSEFVAVDDILDGMPTDLRSALKTAQVSFGRFDESRQAVDRAGGTILFARSTEKVGFRWRDDGHVSPQVIESHSTPIEEAIRLIRSHLARCARTTYVGVPGDHILVANDRVLHGRTALLAGPQSRRWLRRVWIK